MQIITNEDEFFSFCKKLSNDSDGGNFSFAGSELLVHLDDAYYVDEDVSEQICFITLHRLKDDVLARVDEVGQAYLDGKLIFEKAIIFKSSDYPFLFDVAFSKYTNILRGNWS